MKIINIKLLTIIATWLVILLHTAVIPFSYFHQGWSVAVMYETLGRISFPLFILIAGYMFLDKTGPLRTTLKTQIISVLIPLCAWSVFYYFYNRFSGGPPVQFSLLDMLRTPTYGHLWFAYTLIILYLATPVLNTFIQHASQQRVNTILLVWFSLCCVYMLFDNFKESIFKNQVLPAPGNIEMAVFMSGFYIIGGMIRHHKKTPDVIISTVIFILSAVFTAAMCYSLSRSVGLPNEIFLFYSSPTIVTLSIACFFMVLKAPLQFPARVTQCIHRLSRMSIGIFFVHMLVLENLFSFQGISFIGYYSVVTIPLLALACYLISAVIVWVLQRIPVLRHFV